MMQHRLRAATFALLLALAGCKEARRESVTPALWEVSGATGERGWLFGTIHALPEPVDWRSAQVDAVIAGSDMLVLEIADSSGATAKLFARLSRTPGLPTAEQRVSPALRPKLAALMHEYGLGEDAFRDVETWAIAITLSQHAQGEADSRHGIESELSRAVAGKPVGELEGARAQLGIFDSLPEREQQDLLAAIVAEASASDRPDPLGSAWKRGDMKAMEFETRTGLLADPELRRALLENRNRAWAGRIAVMLAEGRHPLVAVGAAHMAGPDGLPALLEARGFKVRRIQ